MRNPDGGNEFLLIDGLDDRVIKQYLHDWRSKNRISQSQAARLLRVPVSTYQGWEQGRPTPYAYIIYLATQSLMPDRR
ncbi:MULTISPECIES: helix-turn-helix domain-containing protein [unclassified Rhizobium]|uniref:helix-turn-helix domain-containing protein n=1 Tax=unclassified Rhizobium TaxID=2613769 RepID=UPI00040B06E0|nr:MULTISPECIES: helix-turn-helix domain-containing protein [unclassified Rhizobium]MBD9455626.1 helix-turn-helix domain-containing protein [Rhizobium sp. RHZ02]